MKPLTPRFGLRLPSERIGQGGQASIGYPGRRRVDGGLVVLTLLFLVAGCAPQQNKLDAVKHAGRLVVLTRNSPTAYYLGPDGPAGIEYDMARAFADSLGVHLKIKVVHGADALIHDLTSGQGDLAAAGLAVTQARLAELEFTTPYQQIHQQVVYQAGTTAPKGPSDLVGLDIEVPAGSSDIDFLKTLQAQYPAFAWQESTEVPVEGLLHRVNRGHLAITIADSNLVAMDRQYYPNLAVAFNLPEPRSLAWAFPKSQDTSLYDAAQDFFRELRHSGELDDLIDHYYAPARRINPFNLQAFVSRITDKLPVYQPYFERAGLRYNIDWRLLAAMGYQESLWRPDAESATGVQGLMMLTNDTSSYLGIRNRLNPEESVEGGARYLRDIMDRLPPHILQPDRTWMALAAYNMGLNHLEDARALTARLGGNPDRWKDVRKRLPLLTEPRYYRELPFGYGQGYQAVQYVNRIRAYYNVLTKVEQDSKIESESMLLKLKAPGI